MLICALTLFPKGRSDVLRSTLQQDRRRELTLLLPALPPLRSSKNRGRLGRKNFRNVSDGAQSWTLYTTFQLADVPLGVAQSFGQLQLAPTLFEATARKLCAKRLGQGSRFPMLVCTNLFGHTPSLPLAPESFEEL